jgi:hypothetical protein
MKRRLAVYAFIFLISVVCIRAADCRADTVWVSPKRLFEIKDHPSAGFFQHIIWTSVSDRERAIYVLAGPPDGIYIYHREDGSSWRQIILDEQFDPGDRICACNNRLWYVHKKQLFEIADSGKPSALRNPLTPLPGEISEIACDAAERLVVVDGTRSEIRRYNSKGNMDLRIGPQESNAAEQKQKPGAKQPAPPAQPPYKSIRAIAIDTFNRIFVLDSHSRTVFPFDQKGKPMKPISDDRFSDSSFPYNSPSIAIDMDSNIWVVNPSENSLDSYSLFGSLSIRFGSGGNIGATGFPFINPSQIIIDANDQLYVVDSATTAIKVFDWKNR